MKALFDAEQSVGIEQPVRDDPSRDYRRCIGGELAPARLPRKVVAPAAAAVPMAAQPLQPFDAIDSQTQSHGVQPTTNTEERADVDRQLLSACCATSRGIFRDRSTGSLKIGERRAS
jgi:hypothetical protein